MKKKSKSETDYAVANEKYISKQQRKDRQLPNSATIAIELKKAKNDEGYSKMPKIKGQKKTMKPVGKGNNVSC